MDIEQEIEKSLKEHLAELQSTLEKNAPPGAKIPDLAAEAEKALKSRPKMLGMDEMLASLPPEACAKISADDLAKLRKMEAENDKQVTETDQAIENMKARLAGTQQAQTEFDMGEQHPFLRTMTRERVIDMHAKSESMVGFNFTDIDLSGLDLSSGRFEGAHFVRTNLKGSRLNGARLNNARFDAADASEADFSESHLQDSIWLHHTLAVNSLFVRAHAKGMKVLGCSFSHANFTGAQLQSSVFNESDLAGACFRDAGMDDLVMIETQAQQADFSGSEWKAGFINRSSIAESCLEKSRSSDMTIWESDARLIRAAGAKLEGLVVGGEGTALDGSCFDGADLSRTSQMNISARGVTARKAIFDDGYLQKVDLSHADWSRSRGLRASVTKCNVANADFSGVNMMGGSWRKSAFRKTDLSEACFYAVDFYQADFIDTRLDAAFTASSGLTQKQRIKALMRAEEQEN
ncbi:pentapeptide repeat-containing protein [Candidatus Methylospira mobilis]|uniref:pentapeptide repeat-containing protein n=1 Tax=Candidatus Methylospira mobilis TaxID=1808979 RepID=UPI0028F0F4DF|nr:pentapeptide repeat-containing protein [Candidatus Methylospira mobilis]WNV03892.1 pentapeptide repeat-containing protein [Candidatus Methylospira mobilis]